MPPAEAPAPGMPAALEAAGGAVEQAVQQMLARRMPPRAVASALLACAVELLMRSMDEAAVARVLENALASIRAGELRPPPATPPAA